MQQVLLNKIDFLVGNEELLLSKSAALHIFDVRVIEFLGQLSKEIFNSGESKRYPDLAALAFWCRKSNLSFLKANYSGMENFIGRGMVFHIAPSNIALSFAYSLIVGLLSGNANVVRLPSREFEQSDIVCSLIEKILKKDEFGFLCEKICLIKYGRDKQITDKLSMMCNSRIIWGGDNTIATIRQSPISPRTNEVTFSNRFSVCVINADAYLNDYDKEKTAQNFYYDTYLNDQNACSSPRIIFWSGARREEAKEVFWDSLYNHLKDYELRSVQTVNKLTAFCKYAANEDCKLLLVNDYKIMRVKLNEIGENLLSNFENSGYFYEFDIEKPEDMLPVFTLECQTLAYIGYDVNDLRELVLKNAPAGVDRIVPVGKTLDFSLMWDGVDLIRVLSRKVEIV